MPSDFSSTGNGTLADDASGAPIAKTRSARRNTPRHHFDVGEKVRFSAGRSPLTRKQPVSTASMVTFEVVRQLPNEGNGFQYRIKNKADGHERIVVEGEISAYELF